MDNIYDFFEKPKNPRIYSGLKIFLASSEMIREWSNGEVKKPETINYRTFKPERDGLFCAKIFGPIKDYECNCGKYKRMKHRGVICEKCGVEVIQSKVRRERLGHIELVTPVSHIWFLKSLPSKLCNVLEISLKNLEKVLYFDSYVVLDPKDTPLKKLDVLSSNQYFEAISEYGEDNIEFGIGAEAVKRLLEEFDLDTEYEKVREEMLATNSVAKRQKLSKRVKILKSFKDSKIDPSCMIMTIVPVLPPDLRPLVPLEGGRFATSDLNDLYRRVINRNNRLKRLTDLKAPDIIVRNEKRMLQEAVDVLFDNGRHGRVVTGTNKRPLKSLSDSLKGKQGRFRQNLLGKRVDYSGRTVVVVGPYLKLHQCGLPKKMALELFKPFIYYQLEKKGYITTVKSAKKLVEKGTQEVWDALDEVVKEYPILLNRAPTLHRLGIQAFEPVLIEGKAIQLHPLVCTAFNADFDGDQMAVHIPLSVESQIEARVLMLSSNNILSPASGQPIIIPTQDMVLGIYYLTSSRKKAKGNNLTFKSPEELRVAYDSKVVDLHANVNVFIDDVKYETTVGRVILWEIIPSDIVLDLYKMDFDSLEDSWAFIKDFCDKKKDIAAAIKKNFKDKKAEELFIGKLKKEEFAKFFEAEEEILDEIFALRSKRISNPIQIGNKFFVFYASSSEREIPFSKINKVVDKSTLRNLIDYAYRRVGQKRTVLLADRLKDIGYYFSTEGGLSICIDDMIIPVKKWDILKEAKEEVDDIYNQYKDGLITDGEKYNKIVDKWAKATEDIAEAMMDSMKKNDENASSKSNKELNAIFMMADSGARGSKDQMRQLAGMRGLMAKPSGEIIETPITANFREGLTVLEYFNSTHGARKGLADTALKTANSGYLTRRLADVAQDCMVVEEDCGTISGGIYIEALREGGEIIQSLDERILGRVAAEDVLDPFTDEVLLPAGSYLDEKNVQKVVDAGITGMRIRSVLTCESKKGVCSKCYARDLSHGAFVEIGQPVGILAAQAIGEPGTQLTMRTFHIGGTASKKAETAEIRAKNDGTIKLFEGLNIVENADGENIVMNRRGGEFAILSHTGREIEKHLVIHGANLLVKDGQKVKADDLLAKWDPYTTPIITEAKGKVKFGDIILGNTVKEQLDPISGKSNITVLENKSIGDKRPRISIKDEKKKTIVLESGNTARYMLPVGAILLVEEGDIINAGDIIAKIPRATTKTKDITGGLPRVAELFEVRKPKEASILSEIDGYVEITQGTKGRQKVIVTPVGKGEAKEYLIPKGKHINVYEGDFVKAGETIIGGSANPQDILNIKGDIALARYLVDEVQEVYRLQGVRINDKHIEVIVRQMMRKVRITSSGDSDFVVDEHVDKMIFAEKVGKIIREGQVPPTAESLILGITKASLSTDSFISAASFQETTKVLTEASIRGDVDELRGLKENVIMGRIIPAGTGSKAYDNIDIQNP